MPCARRAAHIPHPGHLRRLCVDPTGDRADWDSTEFEFVARGRVPHLFIKMNRLTMSGPAKKVAYALGEKGQGDGSQAKVHVAVTALGVQKTCTTSQPVFSAEMAAGTRGCGQP